MDSASTPLNGNEPPELGTFEESVEWLTDLHNRQIADRCWVDKVWVCFRLYESSEEARVGGCCSALLQMMTRSYSEQYKHVELAFRVRDTRPGCRDHVIAWTVDMPGPRHPDSGKVRNIDRDPASMRTYNPERWQCFRMATLTNIETLGMFAYCVRQDGKPMNSTGLYCNFLPLIGCCTGPSRREESSYFCSQLVASALKWVRPHQYAWLEPRRCTPLGLYNILIRERQMFESGEFRSASVLEL